MMYSLLYLRGLAALMVVAFVAGELWARGFGVQNPLVMGYAGVDIFFVVSGFAIWTAVAKSNSALEFLGRRFAGIVPLYWLLTLAVAALLYFTPAMLAPEVFSNDRLLASLFFMPYIQPSTQEALAPVIGAGWAVNYLAAFSLLATVCILLPRNLRLGALTGALSLIVLAGAFRHFGAVAAFYTNAIVLEFALGALIASLWQNGVRLPDIAAVFALFAGMVAFWVFAGTDVPRIIGFGLPAALMLAGAVSQESAFEASPSYFGKFLGEASYSIFLSHGPLLIALTLALNHYLPAMPMSAYLPAAVFVSIIFGGVIHMTIEKPLRAWLVNEPQPDLQLSFDQERRARNVIAPRMVNGRR